MFVRKSQVKSLTRGLTIAFCLFLISVATCSEAADADSIKNVDGEFYSRVLPLIKNAELLIEEAAGEFLVKANAAKKKLLVSLNEEIKKHAAEDNLDAVVQVDRARKFYEALALTPSSGTSRPNEFYRRYIIPFERTVNAARIEYERKMIVIDKFFRKHFTAQKEELTEELSKGRKTALSQEPPDIALAKQLQIRIDAITKIDPPDLYEKKRNDASEQGEKNQEFAIAPFDAQKAKFYQKAWSENLEVGIEVTNSIGMQLKLIPPGTFKMGFDGSDAHEVTLTKPFMLGVYEITQEQYERVMGSNPSKLKSFQHPVEQVSWGDAMTFCQRLSALPGERAAGRVYRLPTEAEWEYSCRAGNTTLYGFGDDASDLGQYAWYEKNSDSHTHPVGQKRPNAWGLYDMGGNVWEWCADWYKDYPSVDVTDPTGPQSGSDRVIRGGCFNSPIFRPANRGSHSPSSLYGSTGFRVVCVPSGQ